MIAWAPDDRQSDAQIAAVLDTFEQTAWTGPEPDRYAWAAVLHRERSGGVHVHALAARCDLETGRSLNIAPPKRFFPLAEELIPEGRHGVGQRVRIELRRAERIPGYPAVEAQFQVVLLAARLGEHPADVVTKIALHFEHERGHAPLGILGVPAEELPREGV